MSGGEPSSIKRSSRCAARAPVLSSWLEDRVGATFDLEVYGLVLRSGTVFVFFELAEPGSAFSSFFGKDEYYASSVLP